MSPTWQWALAALAAYLIGLSKTGIPGLSVLSVAIFATVLPARESTGIVLVVLISADIVSVLAYHNQVSWSQLWRIFPYAAVGVIIGWLILGHIDSLTTQRLIGAILTLIVVIQVARKFQSRQALAAGSGQSSSAPITQAGSNGFSRFVIAPLTGVSAGITTMIANASGPIVILYLLAMGLPKLVFMGTSAWFFFLINLFKLPFSYSLGLLTRSSLQQSLLLAPFAMIGAVSGRLIIRYIDQKAFEWLALILAFVAGMRLLFG
jgi:uncharacterized membrane protein YfcA